MILEDTYRQSLHAERRFKHKAILFIPTESYDAPAIAVVQGLEELGFTIYTLHKPNINSVWCNRVVSSLDGLHFDFVLSNVHWGTRWDYYDHYRLHDRLKVLIDGDDNPHGRHNWLDKVNYRQRTYRPRPKDLVTNRVVQPYRWCVPLGDYRPDILFVSQKSPREQAHYLPFGMLREYARFSTARSARAYDFVHISARGGGKRKRLMAHLKQYPLPGRSFAGFVTGREEHVHCDADRVRRDWDGRRVIHGWNRWVFSRNYFELLSDARALVYPGVNPGPHWDSRRPWEALACGCLVLFERPEVDMARYPVLELCPWAVYEDYAELGDKCRYLLGHAAAWERWRLEATSGAARYFAPVALARYFLSRVAEARDGN
jgi:hypothetical protein